MSKNAVVTVGILVVVVAFGAGYLANRTKDTPQSGQPTNTSSTPSSGKSVDLSGQQLTALPASVLSQTGITSLNLSNNQLTNLDGIEKLSNLQTLNVENNRLETLPSAIGQLKKLKNADFSNNRLTSLPAELGTLTQLQVLNLNSYKGPASDITQLKAQLPNTIIK